MKNLLKTSFAFTLLILVMSCGSRENGQLLGVIDRPAWNGINPYGMVYIPSGTLHIGNSDQDISNTFVQRPKSISIQGFYMDETEITNNEYRQFVYWVKDSIAHSILDNTYESEDGSETYIDWYADIDWESEELEKCSIQATISLQVRKNLM